MFLWGLSFSVWSRALFNPKPADQLRGGVVLLFLLLGACGILRPGEPPDSGPPPGIIDVSTIPDAVPRVEPKSRCGNRSSYKVKRRHYKVLESSEGFVETGIASWYGTKFHGRYTASCEEYDLYGMTAAHKHLPLPTYVEVTNLENGKKVVVRVNDRGPFSGKRVIDLSWVAAAKLDMLKNGTARVRVRAIDPRRYQEKPVPVRVFEPQERQPVPEVGAGPRKGKAPGAGPGAGPRKTPLPGTRPVPGTEIEALFYIQVGAFANRYNADRLKDKLGALGRQVRVVQGRGGIGKLYRVQIGPLADAGTADNIVAKLGEYGIREYSITYD